MDLNTPCSNPGERGGITHGVFKSGGPGLEFEHPVLNTMVPEGRNLTPRVKVDLHVIPLPDFLTIEIFIWLCQRLFSIPNLDKHMY
jgi:hypothetical protein